MRAYLLILAASLLAFLTRLSAALPISISPDDAAIRYVGRFSNDAQFAWTGSQLEMYFTGSSIEVELEVTIGSSAGLTVVIDGVPTFLKVRSGQTTYLLADDLEVGVLHRIVIFKRSEAYFGTVRFQGGSVSDDGTVSAPTAPARKMLVIGDSITCGYGNEALTSDEGNTVNNENGYMSYAPIAARALDADLMMFCWSGRGMFRNFTDDGSDPIPLIFDWTLPWGNGGDWDHSKFVPDVIVINLGTNDRVQSGGRAALTETQYTTAYISFLTTLRTYYPNSKIVLSIGPMGSYLIDDWLVTIAEEFSNTEVLVYTSNKPEDLGGHTHPNVAKDIKMAGELVSVIQALAGWDSSWDDAVALYEKWVLDASVSQGGQMEDPASDGTVNLMEYALGSSPVDGLDSGKMPTIIASSPVGVAYRRRVDHDSRGLNYTIYSSDDLVVWDTSGTVETGTIPIDINFETVQVEVSDGAPAKFFYLEVEVE